MNTISNVLKIVSNVDQSSCKSSCKSLLIGDDLQCGDIQCANIQCSDIQCANIQCNDIQCDNLHINGQLGIDTHWNKIIIHTSMGDDQKLTIFNDDDKCDAHFNEIHLNLDRLPSIFNIDGKNYELKLMDCDLYERKSDAELLFGTVTQPLL